MKIKEKEFEDVIEELKALAGQLGATIRFEKGDFKGGYCLLKDSKVVVINKLANTQRKAIILSQALKELGVENIYLTPKIREIIDQMNEEK
ncbi:MAG: hypothetical protein COW85_03400 [Ignavibacteria bacterium CG22_combo_CG10-13_8_21_14_all_37_15]|nr:hypothetical protein [Ignavibacteria bacterium]OIO23614.1 MAG: hypothetical protein AUJ54_01280 [Ignavibacteria bacterium CG1_02_37_35]PIP78682.1 MAG: hypothetical protein COW85_03400 [Ignavibacteria bacterium CG22_combo_CG10-13_8_21_14_all_37_15]PIS46086.1 MAG: hypothetical protein COT22_01765 [Ignavibacteria bacterium CG08_land_8_20_14_0_20_37_9]PJC61193.1 MAG: hypothetical protein CO025_00255 [Ignavibacteria bacterium CG_4_9_14_0_2_um_filter_37_13]